MDARAVFESIDTSGDAKITAEELMISLLGRGVDEDQVTHALYDPLNHSGSLCTHLLPAQH